MLGRSTSGIRKFLPAILLLLSSGSAWSEPPSTNSAERRECGLLANTFVSERLAVWQKRLKLEDWKIAVSMSHPSDLKPKTLGNIHWDADTKSAVIRVLDASEYQLACRETMEDMEFTIVHELIHLELSSLPRSDASRRDEEHAVNQIADALLKLDRGR